MSDRTRLIVRAAMTEYMILMAGALLLYAAQQMWPHSLTLISLVGGLGLAALCVINLILVLRMPTLPEDSAPVSGKEE